VLTLLATACSAGKKHGSTAATTSSSSSAPGAPLQISLTTGARGPERGFNATAAAKQAAPGLQQFLNRYVTTAFLQPSEGKKGWSDLLVLFDPAVRTSAKQQLDSLSLGSAAAQVTTMRPGRADAKAVALFRGGHVVAATVQLAFNATADTAQGSGPIQLHAVFQLLRSNAGWRIASFKSSTGSSP